MLVIVLAATPIYGVERYGIPGGIEGKFIVAHDEPIVFVTADLGVGIQKDAGIAAELHSRYVLHADQADRVLSCGTLFQFHFPGHDDGGNEGTLFYV